MAKYFTVILSSFFVSFVITLFALLVKNGIECIGKSDNYENLPRYFVETIRSTNIFGIEIALLSLSLLYTQYSIVPEVVSVMDTFRTMGEAYRYLFLPFIASALLGTTILIKSAKLLKKEHEEELNYKKEILNLCIDDERDECISLVKMKDVKEVFQSEKKFERFKIYVLGSVLMIINIDYFHVMDSFLRLSKYLREGKWTFLQSFYF